MKKFFLGYFIASLFSSAVYANLLVTPTRVELDNKAQRSAVFSLVNKGKQDARYNIYFEDKKLLPTGDYVSLENSSTSLAKFVRYSPRRVSLAPEEGTRVRMALRLPKGTPEGEYRSYIVFHQIPLAPTAIDNEQKSTSNTLSLSVTAYMRISIPVILRLGALSSEIFIDADLDRKAQSSVDVTLVREGLRSSYGDIELFLVSNGKELESVGSYKNAAVYTELTARTFAIELSKPVERGRELIVRYRESESLSDAKVVETRIVL